MPPPCAYLLAKEWAAFRDRVAFPAGVEDAGRRVFFAGAATFYSLMLTSADPQATINTLKAELLEYAAAVRQEPAK